VRGLKPASARKGRGGAVPCEALAQVAHRHAAVVRVVELHPHVRGLALGPQLVDHAAHERVGALGLGEARAGGGDGARGGLARSPEGGLQSGDRGCVDAAAARGAGDAAAEATAAGSRYGAGVP